MWLSLESLGSQKEDIVFSLKGISQRPSISPVIFQTIQFFLLPTLGTYSKTTGPNYIWATGTKERQHSTRMTLRTAQLHKISEWAQMTKGCDGEHTKTTVTKKILALKASFQKSIARKAELKVELKHIHSNTLWDKKQTKWEAAQQWQLTAEINSGATRPKYMCKRAWQLRSKLQDRARLCWRKSGDPRPKCKGPNTCGSKETKSQLTSYHWFKRPPRSDYRQREIVSILEWLHGRER